MSAPTRCAICGVPFRMPGAITGPCDEYGDRCVTCCATSSDPCTDCTMGLHSMLEGTYTPEIPPAPQPEDRDAGTDIGPPTNAVVPASRPSPFPIEGLTRCIGGCGCTYLDADITQVHEIGPHCPSCLERVREDAA